MKRLVALLVCLLMVTTMFAGCVVKEEADTTDTSSEGTSADEGEGEVVAEPTEITILTQEQTGKAPFDADTAVVEELGKRTNTIVKFNVVPRDNFQDKYNVLVSSKNLPDIVVTTVENINKYGTKGAYVKMNEMWDEYGPNIKSFVYSQPDYIKILKAFDGNVYAIAKETFLRSTTANFIRQDWLDRLGLEVPTTLDECVEVLRAFRDKDANGNGDKNDEIPWGNKGGEEKYISHAFVAPFGIPNKRSEFVPQNGAVIYGPADPRMKEAIKFLKSMLAEGLIDQEFATMTGQLYESKRNDNRIGGLHHWIGSVSSENKTMQDKIPGFHLTAFAPLKGPGGKIAYTGNHPLIDSNSAAIPVTTDNKVEAMKLLDYLYSEEGSFLMNWGLEGEHYTEVNGELRYTDMITKNEKYPDIFDAMRSEGIYLAIPYIFDKRIWPASSALGNPEDTNARELTRPYLGKNLPKFKLSEEEKEKEAQLIPDIETYKEEMILKFILGTEPLSKFEEYVNNLNDMGLDEILTIYQKHYEEYMAK